MASFVVVFLVSLWCISLELFFTRILNLKAWNHVVYTIVPFAMLGYGIGANVVFICKDFLKTLKPQRLLAALLACISVFSLASAFLIKDLPIRVEDMLTMFTSIKSAGMLGFSYTLFTIPFFFIGFTVVYVFITNPKDSHRLYFLDLIGAGLGAFLFFPLIINYDVFHSLAIMSLAGVLTALWLLASRLRWVLFIVAVAISVFAFRIFPEPTEYAIDIRKSWEWIPHSVYKEDYEQMASRWHPLGRTDIFRIKGAKAREALISKIPMTFEINLEPKPEFAFVATNFLAGTPIFKMSDGEGNPDKVKLFSQSMEAPYTLLHEPKVVVIGAGGGRDIFVAHTHGAKEVVAAEINPGIVQEMSPGGAAYDYSGRIYTSPNTKVLAIDGRHLVKQLPGNSQDLIVLNGVDTFSGLSSGAYAYAESYLYTKDAMKDYLRVLNDGGMINMVRWAFLDKPREELRLFAIALAALKEMGVKNPLDHIMVGVDRWSLFLIKKTPFTQAERSTVETYFRKTGIYPIFPQQAWVNQTPQVVFNEYAACFKNNVQANYEHMYPYDISVITDDNPFFYKYYKFTWDTLLKPFAYHHTGPVIFLTQVLILLQALVFILLFIFVPLLLRNQQGLPSKAVVPFVTFFACLGVGFMFIEIPLMQRFVLLLGSPIYSLSVVLAVLLAATGLGSLAVPWMEQKNTQVRLTAAGCGLIAMLLVLVYAGTGIYDAFMGSSLTVRVLLVAGTLLPIGFLLGIFFPLALRRASQAGSDGGIVAWGWGINCAFSVLGGILAIIIAQFQGFNAVLLLACVAYCMALLAFRRI